MLVVKLGVARLHSGGSQRENGDRWVPFSINLRFKHMHGSDDWSERGSSQIIVASSVRGTRNVMRSYLRENERGNRVISYYQTIRSDHVKKEFRFSDQSSFLLLRRGLLSHFNNEQHERDIKR